VLRFVNDDFQENKEPTIGGEYILARIILIADKSERIALPVQLKDC
jgi:hypothetical protein